MNAVTTLPEMAPATPEIFLAIAALALLMFGVFRGQSGQRMPGWLAVAALTVTMILGVVPTGTEEAFFGRFVTDASASIRSEERRVGKEGVSTVEYRWWPYH